MYDANTDALNLVYSLQYECFLILSNQNIKKLLYIIYTIYIVPLVIIRVVVVMTTGADIVIF